MCCVAADWLQGPYLYALYAAYGYSESAIMALFVGAEGVILWHFLGFRTIGARKILAWQPPLEGPGKGSISVPIRLDAS